MTVKELRKQLKKFPKDAHVIINVHGKAGDALSLDRLVDINKEVVVEINDYPN